MIDSPSPAPAGERHDLRRRLLIETKMNAPRLPSRCVSRRAQLDLLQQGLARKLTVLVAPAGFGKTTLLADWCRSLAQNGHIVGWVSIDADDDDLDQLSAYMLAALRRGSTVAGGRAAELLGEDAPAPAKPMLEVLLNDVAALAQPVVLVLDDFDRLMSPAIHETLFRVLRYAPENLHVVLAGRTQPGVPLSYFRLREQLTLIDVEQLRFDAEQAQQFVSQVVGTAVSTEDTRQLLAATEGWVAGLQLACLSLRERADGPRPLAHNLVQAGLAVDAYLGETVLPEVPPHVLDFLLASAVPERLSPALCDALTGRDDGRRTIDWVESRNLFIRPVDGTGTWYRYHALFRDYLLRRLERQGEGRAAALHRVAASWFATQGLWPEAVRHALAAGDEAQAADWVDQCAMGMVERSDAHTVLRWVARMPASALVGRVRLRLAYAWALAMTLHTGEVDDALRALRAEIDRGAPLSDAMRCEMLAVTGVAAALNDDSIEALKLGTEIAAMQPDEGSWVAEMGETVLVYGLMYAARFDEIHRLKEAAGPFPGAGRPVHAHVYRRGVFGLSAWLAGDLHEAARLLEQALAYAESSVGRLSAAAALPAGYLSLVMYEWNDIARVAQLLQDRLELAAETSSISAVMGLYLGTARLAALGGDIDGARRRMDEGVAHATRRRWVRMVAALGAESVRLDIGQGRLASAQRTVAGIEAMLPAEPPSPRHALTEAWHAARIARCRCLIAQGQAADAVPLLEAQIADGRLAGMAGRVARSEVLLALALCAVDRGAQALDTMAGALAYGQQQGLVRSIVDEGEEARRLVLALQRERRPNLQAWYLERLLKAFGDSRVTSAGPADGAPAARLSAREVEILDFIAQGLSNKEIARALRVAPETIKWHLKNIYEKLNVSSRMQAVQCGLGVDLPLSARGPRAP